MDLYVVLGNQLVVDGGLDGVGHEKWYFSFWFFAVLIGAVSLIYGGLFEFMAICIFRGSTSNYVLFLLVH